MGDDGLYRKLHERALRDRTRRHFFVDCGLGLGAMALGSLLRCDRQARGATNDRDTSRPRTPGHPVTVTIRWRLAPVISRLGRRASFTCSWPEVPASSSSSTTSPACGITAAGRSRIRSSRADGSRSWTPLQRSILGCWGRPRRFARHGESGAWVSELLPNMAGIVDDLAFVKSAATDVFNHAPAKLFANTGTRNSGGRAWARGSLTVSAASRPSLPGFVVLQSGPRGPRGGAVNWGSGFLPSAYQGVPLRSGGDPILNLATPPGISRHASTGRSRRSRR